MDALQVQEAITSAPSFEQMVKALECLVRETQQLKHERLQRIVKLKIPKPAPDDLNDINTTSTSNSITTTATSSSSPDTYNTNSPITTPENAVSTLPTPITSPPTFSIMSNCLFEIDQKTLDILQGVTIHYVWANSILRKKPATPKIPLKQPPSWISHLEYKGYKFIGCLFRVGAGVSSKILGRTIVALLKAPPKYFDLTVYTKNEVFGIEWRDVEEAVKKLQSKGDNESSETRRSEDTVEPPEIDDALMASPVGPPTSTTIESSTPEQPPKKKRRKRRHSSHSPVRSRSPSRPPVRSPSPVVSEGDPRTPDPPSRLSDPPDTQRSKLRQGVRNHSNLSDLYKEYLTSDEDSCSNNWDSNDEESGSNSGEDEYQESNSNPSEDGNRSISEVTDDEVTEEESEDEDSCGPPKKRRTPSSFWKSQRAQNTGEGTDEETAEPREEEEEKEKEEEEEEDKQEEQEASEASEVPRRTRLRRKSKGRNRTKSHDGNQIKDSNPPNSCRASAPIPSSSPGRDSTPKTPRKRAKRATPNNRAKSLPVTQASQPPKPAKPLSVEKDMIYISTGFKAEEILTEFKALRNLTKQNYELFKYVQKNVEKLAKEQRQQNQKLDKLVEEMAEVKETLKEAANTVNLLLSFCKGQDL
ncbi:hypothetical protein TWF481_001739 [Arthrobotrys musiformis]|uniref:Uncharacterized protein n=1 Tax=Arthrobotrys musiformis TaxID=47236 RepID=A0AAV9VVY8_9PEZI